MELQATKAAPPGLWDWAVSSDTAALVGWVGLAITLVGLVPTLWGLYLTYQQARDAKIAAGKAKDAASAAKTAAQQIRSSVDIAESSLTAEKLSLLLMLVNLGEMRAAQVQYQTIRHAIGIRFRIGSEQSTTSPAVRLAISVIDTQLPKGADGAPDYKSTRLKQAISGLMSIVNEWQADALKELPHEDR
jgi:hypothetical protein